MTPAPPASYRFPVSVEREETPVSSGRAADCLRGGGEMGELLRRTDWGSTRLGPVERWPQSLRTAVSIVLSSRFGMYIAWGRDYLQFYNDAYRPILGSTKHPAVGKHTSETFAESWHIIGPLFEQVMEGEAVGSEDWMLPLDRNGYLEECFFTFCYSPIRVESGEPGGVLVTVSETTSRVLGERRLRALRDLGVRAARATTDAEAWRSSAEVLAESATDLPFAILYELSEGVARRVAAVHLDPSSPAAPAAISPVGPSPWPLFDARAGAVVVDDVLGRFGEIRGPAWPEPVRQAVVLPIRRPSRDTPYGFLVAGISPRRALDGQYRSFLDLVADPIATALSNAHALEDERKRAALLAERDRGERARLAAFFTQVPVAVAVLRGPEHRFDFANPRYSSIAGNRILTGLTVRQAFPELEGQGIYELLDRVYATGEPFVGNEVPLQFDRHGDEGVVDAFFDFTYQPMRDRNGAIAGIIVAAVDVTGQVAARRQLRVSEERYRSLVDAARQIIWTNSAEGEMRGEQAGWARITGQTIEQYQGFGWADALHPDDRAETLERWQRAVKTKSVFDAEHRVRNPAGDWRTYSVRAVPLLEADGSIREWVGVHTDITAQRKAEAESELERKRLRNVFDGAPVAIAVTRGPEHRFESSNALYAQLMGRDVGEQTFREAFPELAGQGVFEALDGVYQSGNPFIAREYRAMLVRSGEAEEGFFDFIYQPLREPSGAVGRIMQLAYEVTGQVRARQAVEMLATSIRESEARFRTLAEAIPEAVWTAGPDGVVDFGNTRWREYYGSDDFATLAARGWDIHPDDQKVAISGFALSLREGSPYEAEFRIRRAMDGAWRWHLSRAVAVRDPQGNILRWVGSNADIHDRKETEQVRERLIAALERSNAELDQFAYVASHDLKAPLRGIGNLSEWLEEDLGPLLTGAAKEKLHKLRGRVYRMEALIDGILDYSRAGRVRHKAERVEVSRLIGEVTELLAPKTGVAIEVGPSMPVLTTERVPLQQVFMNLVGNALKHARRDDARIEVRVADDASFFRFTVKDNGQGIAPEFHERIWGIFQTLEARDKVEGAGIGLSVVRKIVESRGGAAWVESAPGAGAAFHFTWPKREEG